MLPLFRSRSSEWTGREGAFRNCQSCFNGGSEPIKGFLSFNHFRLPDGFVARVARLILGRRRRVIRHSESSEMRVYLCCLRVNQFHSESYGRLFAHPISMKGYSVCSLDTLMKVTQENWSQSLLD